MVINCKDFDKQIDKMYTFRTTYMDTIPNIVVGR